MYNLLRFQSQLCGHRCFIGLCPCNTSSNNLDFVLVARKRMTGCRLLFSKLQDDYECQTWLKGLRRKPTDNIFRWTFFNQFSNTKSIGIQVELREPQPVSNISSVHNLYILQLLSLLYLPINLKTNCQPNVSDVVKNKNSEFYLIFPIIEELKEKEYIIKLWLALVELR